MRHSQLEFDFDVSVPVPRSQPALGPCKARQRRGQSNYYAGLAAEAAVERHYEAQGLVCLDRRWRGPAGEIDLIFRDGSLDGGRIVFVEVKAGRSFDAAAGRIRQRQADRIGASAMFYLDQLPSAVSEMRIDVALVDQLGAVSVLENAFAGWL
jgi:putative endonuclease